MMFANADTSSLKHVVSIVLNPFVVKHENCCYYLVPVVYNIYTIIWAPFLYRLSEILDWY